MASRYSQIERKRREQRHSLDRVCELLLRASFGEQKGESLLRMIGKGATRGGNLARARTMNDGHNEIAHGSHHLGGVAGAELRAIFTEAHNTHVVQTILDVPMPTGQFQ